MLFELMKSDIFVGELSIEAVAKMSLCCKTLYSDLREEYMQALHDVFVHTWHKRHTMYVSVWGRGWHASYISNLAPYFTHELCQDTEIHVSNSLYYTNKSDGSTQFTCDDWTNDDDTLETFFIENFPNVSNTNTKHKNNYIV